MELETHKIKLYLILILFIAVATSVVGFITLYTGLFFKEYDKGKAEEMLKVIEATDKTLYEKIAVEEDPDYTQEFRNLYTKKGKPSLVFFGILLILTSIGSIVPAALTFHEVSKDESGGEIKQEAKGDKKEKEPAKDTGRF